MASLAEATRALDGISTTLISGHVRDWEVMVGGGPDRFVVTATSAAGRIANALHALGPGEDEGDTVDLTVGEQGVDYPVAYALDRHELDRALSSIEQADPSGDRWEVMG